MGVRRRSINAERSGGAGSNSDQEKLDAPERERLKKPSPSASGRRPQPASKSQPAFQLPSPSTSQSPPHASPRRRARVASATVELNPAEQALEQRLGAHFRHPELLQLAVTHRSWSQGAGRPDAPTLVRDGAADDNERLEFLGDAVLGLRVSERLWEAFPTSSEGQLSRLRSWIVSARYLATVAQRLSLGEALRLSRAEESIGGRGKPRLLANALEAIIAAIHLDGGYAAASSFIDRQVLGSDFEHLSPAELHAFAYKSTLQEWTHSAGHSSPVYEVVAASGPDHERVFTVRAEVPGVVAAEASAGSKKEAEQRAAGQVLAQLGLLGANGSGL